MKIKSFFQGPFITILFICLIASPVLSKDIFSIRGYYKNFSILFMMPSYSLQNGSLDEPDIGAVNNHLRLILDVLPIKTISFHLAYDVSLRIQDLRLFGGDGFAGSIASPDYRCTDFRDRIYPGPYGKASSFGLFHNLDRFYLAVKTDFADITIGRQAIAWGSAHFVNPTDIIAPFAFNELDKEERPGVDALRVRIPLGTLDELDLGFIAGRNFKSDNNALFLRAKTYKFQTDISALLIAFRKNLLIGLDLTRSIGGAGVWLETAYVIPGYFKNSPHLIEKNYIRASTGFDYNFSSNTYAFFEYHFNSSGSNEARRYSDSLTTSAYLDGSVYLLGKHYLNIGTVYQLTPLTPLSGMFILNLSDGSFVLAPLIEYNIAENIYLAAGTYLGFGRNPEIPAASGAEHSFLYKSEFGTYPDMVYLSFRLYF